MVGATRGTPSGFGASGSEPLPPPPSFTEIFATQTELLRQIVQDNSSNCNSEMDTVSINPEL